MSKIFVNGAIGMRMVIGAISSTIIKPIKQKLKRSHKAADTYIVSSNPSPIIKILHQEGFSENVHNISKINALPISNNPINIILDDREMNYNSIIHSIMKHSHQNHYFHIFSGRNNIIISPKSQR
jgi:hypothetical protein